jgi:hypothetical protein
MISKHESEVKHEVEQTLKIKSQIIGVQETLEYFDDPEDELAINENGKLILVK